MGAGEPPSSYRWTDCGSGQGAWGLRRTASEQVKDKDFSRYIMKYIIYNQIGISWYISGSNKMTQKQ